MIKEEVVNRLKSLPIGSKFNVCWFGDNYEFLFQSRSVKVDEQSVELACERLRNLKQLRVMGLSLAVTFNVLAATLN